MISSTRYNTTELDSTAHCYRDIAQALEKLRPRRGLHEELAALRQHVVQRQKTFDSALLTGVLAFSQVLQKQTQGRGGNEHETKPLEDTDFLKRVLAQRESVRQRVAEQDIQAGNDRVSQYDPDNVIVAHQTSSLGHDARAPSGSFHTGISAERNGASDA